MLQDGSLVEFLAQVGEVTDELLGAFRNPALLYGIPLALVGAVLMAFGALYQHSGVVKVDDESAASAEHGLRGGHIASLARRPSWWAGTAMLALAVVFQLAALSIAPLIVVQPIGAIALVFTAMLNWRRTGVKPSRQAAGAIALCLAGIGLFVTLATLFATDHETTHRELWTVLIVLAVAIVAVLLVWLLVRGHVGPLFYIVVGGAMYGFVVTLAKVVISRLQAGTFDLLTFVCALALIGAFLVGTYFVQSAYAAGSPDLVVAGLTVVDPLVAVLIALLVLREAVGAPLIAQLLFPVAGAIAVAGVILLARSQTPLTIADAAAQGSR